jgi:heptosyltransferase I
LSLGATSSPGGVSGTVPGTAPRILIVKLSSLGDVVHAMAAVQDLRRAYPQAQIDWVVERAFAPLVARCEGVRRIIPCALRQWRKSPFCAQTRSEWGVFKTALQQEAYDAVIDLQGLSKSALLCWLAQTRVGGLRYAMANRTEGSSYEAPTRWAADRAIALAPHVHAVQRARLLCAAALAYPLEGEARFGLRAGTLAVAQPQPRAAHTLLAHTGAAANPFAPRKSVVALVHGTSRADKEWPIDHWIELGQRLNHSGFCVALAHGSAAEKATSEQIAAALTDAWVWPTMPLDALVDTMAHCAGVIGVDSGLSHIAVALNLPHVQIYNFDTAWRTGVTNARQVCVFASPTPAVEAVWQAWDALATPVLCQ